MNTASKTAKISQFALFCALAWVGFSALNKRSEESIVESEGLIMNSNQYEFYGVKGGDSEILGIIDRIAEGFHYNANIRHLKSALFEIIAVESDFGYAKDSTRSSGEGLTQFDKTTYNELRDELLKKQMFYFGIQNTTYDLLRTNPELQIFMVRYFLYRRIPSKIGDSIETRAQQWKTYYNTIYGKGTISHYKTMAEKHYKRLGVSY